MASKIKEQKSKIKAKIDAVKRIADDGEKSFKEKSDKFLNDLPTTDALFGKKLSDFAEKRKKKKENNKDIFGELIDTVEGFLGTNNKIKTPRSGRNKRVEIRDIKSRLLFYWTSSCSPCSPPFSFCKQKEQQGEKGERNHKRTGKENWKKLLDNLPKDKQITIINESPSPFEDSIDGLKLA
jgi:hypothetical protein